MFTLSVFTRVLPVNNPMSTVLNADILAIYIGVSVSFLVKCAISLSVQRISLFRINAFTILSPLMFVMCVVRHSRRRALLKNINASIVVSALILVKCVIRLSVNGPV
jgi:hypothetical protein